MWIRFLTLFLFVSCTQATASSDLTLNFTSEQKGLNPSKSYVQTQKPLERCGNIKDAIRLDRKFEGKHELSDDIRNGHHGKGAYGGANDNQRPRRSHSSAPSLSSWIFTLILYVNLALIFLISFQLF